ncbi:hypothetical protein CH381_27055 [Leptospira sp. mixed culture ATI2-C-A1]|nr:hypothetical protein CH381_27055 [Leptospira sp. mixed culture ATI2-C-A1]
MKNKFKKSNNKYLFNLISIYNNSILSNETKSLTIIGFYVAYFSILFTSDLTILDQCGKILLLISNIVISISVLIINTIYRNWKKHYTILIKQIFLELKIKKKYISNQYKEVDIENNKTSYFSTKFMTNAIILIIGLVSNIYLIYLIKNNSINLNLRITATYRYASAQGLARPAANSPSGIRLAYASYMPVPNVP